MKVVASLLYNRFKYYTIIDFNEVDMKNPK